MRRNTSRKPEGIEGVTQRQRRRNLSDFNSAQPVANATQRKAVSINKNLNKKSAYESAELITEQDVIESTRSSVDESKIGKSGWRAKRKAKKLAKKQKWARRPWPLRWARRVFRYGGALVIIFGLYNAAVAFTSLNNIIDRGGDGALALQENIQPTALKGEGDGRINIMMIGIGGDGHKAGNLADSIMVASIDPFAKEAAMLSIPRDMYVDIPGFYSSRINAAHAIGEDEADLEGGGIALMQQTLEETLDINIHYYVRVDFTGFAKAIDTIGGVTVDLDEAVYDPNFDWEFGYNALNLPAGESTLDGQTALLLARSRNATGLGYGTGNDFDRAENQRRILLAAREKVLSAGTYANPLRITELISIAGGHVRTNIQIGEMLALYDIVDQIPEDKIVSFGLSNAADNYLASANIGGASVLQPKSGSYLEIQLFVRELFIDGFIRQEAPVIDVYNGSIVAGLAGETATELESYGYGIGVVDNAPTQTYENTVVYDLSNGEKEFTKQLIANRFEVTMLPGSQAPAELQDTESHFIVILGADDATQEESTF